MSSAISTDGSEAVDRILQRVEDAMADDLMPVEIYNDEDIFKAEMDYIFTRTWVFVAHESEIPNAGDFVQRRIGLDPVIVTRDGEGNINVLSNYCRHRGTQVCQTDQGNSRFFTCPYHGWTYSNNGDLVGTPLMHRAYGEPVDKKEWGLLRAPRVATRQGFIFASLSEDVPPLDEHLGSAGWMLDLIAGLHPDGMRVAGPPERYHVHADWKSAAENFAGDVYHTPSLHGSTEEIGMGYNLDKACEFTRTYEFENGHTFTGHAWGSVMGPDFDFWGYHPSVREQFDLSKLDEAQLRVVKDEPPTIGTIFPNLSYIRVFSITVPPGPPAVFTSFRQWQPIGPGEMELWNWQFVWNFQSDEEALRDAVTGQFNFGSAGLLEQDDTVAWEGPARAGASPWARKVGMKFHFQQGNKSEVDQTADPTWTGPGVHRLTGYGEHVQFNFYRHWLRAMKSRGAVFGEGQS